MNYQSWTEDYSTYGSAYDTQWQVGNDFVTINMQYVGTTEITWYCYKNRFGTIKWYDSGSWSGTTYTGEDYSGKLITETIYSILGLTTIQTDKLTVKGYDPNNLPASYTSGYVYVGNPA